jgi:hypothetical protein
MPVIYIPYKILLLFKKLHREYPDVEVGIFVKGEFDKNYNVYVKNDIYVPEQEVTGGNIVFKEPPPKGYNGVIHKHPLGVTSFSITDHENINRNFEFSILYEDRVGFCDACIRIQANAETYIIVPAKVELVYDELKFEIPRHKIKKSLFYPSRYTSSIYGNIYENDYNFTYESPTIEELMNKYGFKKTKKGLYEKLEKDDFGSYKITIKEIAPNKYKFTATDLETDMVVYDATCSNLDDLENYIMMYSDPIL